MNRTERIQDLVHRICVAAALMDDDSQARWFYWILRRVAELDNEPLSSQVATTLIHNADRYNVVYCSPKQAWAVASAAIDNNIVR